MPLVEDSRSGTLGYGRIPTGTVSTATKGSLYFDGQTSFLTVANDADFQLGTGNFTIEWFQRFNSDTNMPTIFSQGAFANTGLAITQTTLFSTQSNLLQPGNPVYVWPPSSIVNANTDVSRVVDGLSSTTYINPSRYDAGLIIRPSTQTIVNRVGFTTATDKPECDPLLFTIEGIRDIQTSQSIDYRNIWSNPFGAGANTNGTIGNKIPIEHDGRNLYYGGNFTSIGGISANYISQWNGINWSTLGAGLNDTCKTLCIYGSTLFAGGEFTTADGISATRLAAWNLSTSKWSAVVNINAAVEVIRVFDNKLYIGGSFTTVGSFGMNRIAYFDFSTKQWSTFGAAGLNSAVYDIFVSSNIVYTTGNFTTAGGVSANRIARWNGTAWSAMGTGLASLGLGLELIGPNLYVCGSFTTAGGITVNRIARWNTSLSTWNALGSGLSDQGNVLLAIGNDLYVCGQFATAGGILTFRIARWNGSAWFPVGSGANNIINGMYAQKNTLYLGGGFTAAGDISTTRIAAVDISPFNIFSGNVYGGPFEPIAINLSTNCELTRNSRSFSADLNNTTPYAAYRIRFPQLRDDLAASSILQLSELEFTGSSIQHQVQVLMNGSTLLNASVGPTIQRWSHFALQRSTNLVSLLQDGSFISSFTFPYTFANTTDPLYIGRMKDTYNSVSTILTTIPATEISAFSSLSGGAIQSIGSDVPTRKGIVWNTVENPTIFLSTQQSYAGISMAGPYPNVITGLEPSTFYYVRSFATSAAGIGYGNQVSFVTKPWSPYVSTLSVSGFSSIVGLSTAFITATGSIISTNGSTVTTRGFVWDTTSTPTFALSTKTTEVGLFDIGPFSTIASLANSSFTYYFRAYAINGVGISYGDVIQGKQNAIESLFGTLSSDVVTAKAQIEGVNAKLFATPIIGALAENIVKQTPITTTGRFDYSIINQTFLKLYATYFDGTTRLFTIEWTFTDGTNSMNSFFLKSNTTNLGAFYTFKVYNNSGALIYTSDTSSRKWCFSDGMNYAGLASRNNLSADDGIWGAAKTGNLNGNAGPALSTNIGWGIQNYNGSDTTFSGYYNNSTTLTSTANAKAFVYFL